VGPLPFHGKDHTEDGGKKGKRSWGEGSVIRKPSIRPLCPRKDVFQEESEAEE